MLSNLPLTRSLVSLLPKATFGDVQRLITTDLGFPTPATREDTDRVNRHLHPTLATRDLVSHHPNNVFYDAGNYPILLNGAEEKTFLEKQSRLQSAEASPDPYIRQQAKLAQHLLVNKLAEQATNLDVTEVSKHPEQFPIESSSQAGGTEASYPPEGSSASNATKVSNPAVAEAFNNPYSGFDWLMPAAKGSEPQGLEGNGGRESASEKTMLTPSATSFAPNGAAPTLAIPIDNGVTQPVLPEQLPPLPPVNASVLPWMPPSSSTGVPIANVSSQPPEVPAPASLPLGLIKSGTPPVPAPTEPNPNLPPDSLESMRPPSRAEQGAASHFSPMNPYPFPIIGR
jgi:hypothetical protein